MTTGPTSSFEAWPAPEWLRPPTDGYTTADLDSIPGVPTHTELIDGSLVLRGPQSAFHTLALDVLVQGLRRCASPARFRVRREMTLVLGRRQRPEPDAMVIHAEAGVDPEATWYPADAVILAAEVVSPASAERDRSAKPRLYARAGIPHLWRIEEVDGRVTVYVYELDPATCQYLLMGIFHERLKLSVPFPVDIDFADIDWL
ncbi:MULTISPECIES: Uma2 family endonuclease [Actinoplanes]|uniref:Uma2 family endonuclease n=1 Tax=Actinoplanes TaxID=1865 RepID=UPI0005F283C5|nr:MULTISPECIES: Uma2 family endonuclease [Actinoplanes]GLX99696.1 hypothetical protein Acsp01_00760 [Actinoplanes sp. NBRC 101535]